MADSHRIGRTLGIGVLALAVATGGALLGHRLWVGKRYPLAVPSGTAHRLDARTQAVYDALGLDGATLDIRWPGSGLGTDTDACPPTGLRHLTDAVKDEVPDAAHTARVSETWGLSGVPHAGAVAAVQRARATLTRDGWKVLAAPHPPGDLELRLRPPRSDDTVTIDTFPAGHLQVTAHAVCARYPTDTPVDTLGEPVLPAMHAPAELRH